jgi:hypothetical protein
MLGPVYAGTSGVKILSESVAGPVAHVEGIVGTWDATAQRWPDGEYHMAIAYTEEIVHTTLVDYPTGWHVADFSWTFRPGYEP